MFNAKKEIENIIRFIKKYYKDNNLRGAIIGISGGKDSAVAVAILVKALGKKNVIGLFLPCHSTNNDKKYAELISKHFDFKLINHDLTEVFDTFKNNIEIGYSEEMIVNSDINLKPRLRMATLYYYAAMYSDLKRQGYLVCGTSNKSENYVGYFTKGGDNVHDISFLNDFTVNEVIELGVTYKDIEKVINKEKLEVKTYNKIQLLHNKNKHKFKVIKYNRNIQY